MVTRVVIADDEWLMAFLLKSEFEQRGYEVVGLAGTGTEAFALCREKTPDIVMMDIQMPEMDGLEATREVMQTCPTCVVIVTGKGQQEQAAERAGAMCCVTKPIFGEHITSLVETAQIRFQQFLEIREHAAGFDETIQQWLQVRKAVSVLMKTEGLSEDTAFVRLHQRALTEHLPMHQIAEAIVTAASLGWQGVPLS